MNIAPWLRVSLAAALLWSVTSTAALAWSRPGHMVTAAIAYRELMASDPKVVARVVEILASHPEPGPFEVAIGRATGQGRVERIFMEIPRWPDDIRGSEYDHPTWHYVVRPLIDQASPPPSTPWYATSGSAAEALALNISIARNPRASAKERAIALCWIFHIVGDVHQPLHSAEYFSKEWPDGDFAGDKIFLVDPQSAETVKLHWFWDDAVHQLAEADQALSRAQELTSRFSRSAFRQELERDRQRAEDVNSWSLESYEVAKAVAYRADGPRAREPANAIRPTPAYVSDSKEAAERRLTLAGYRLADVLRSIFPEV